MTDIAAVPEFTDQELRDALKRVGSDEHRALFNAGQPIVFLQGQNLIARYKDGREVVLKRVDHATEPASSLPSAR